jgi:hypothetical protein
MRLNYKRLLTACLLMLLPVAALGCGGGSKGTVSGEVSLDGKPLPAGNVIFTPANGPAVAGPIKDGKYTAEGVPTGDVRVSLDLAQLRMLVGPGGGTRKVRRTVNTGIPGGAGKSTNVKPGGALPQGMPEEARKQMAAAQQAAATARKAAEEAGPIMQAMPPKYEDPTQSGLTTKVSTGSNTYDLKLTSK